MSIVKMSKKNNNVLKKPSKVAEEKEEIRPEFAEKIKRRSKQKPVDFKI